MNKKDENEKIEQLLKKEICKINSYYESYVTRKQEWNESCSKHIYDYLKNVETIYKKGTHRCYRQLYVTTTDVSVQIFFGEESLPQTKEQGSYLVFSLGGAGDVLCSIYLCESEYKKYNVSSIIYKHYNNPKQVTNKEINNALKAFFVCHRISSSLLGYSWRDIVYFQYMKLKGVFKFKWYEYAAKIKDLVMSLIPSK